MNETDVLIEVQRIAVIGTLAAAIIGGLIGFLGSWLSTSIAARTERKRLLLQLGFEMGMKQWNNIYEHSDKLKRPGDTLIIGQPSSFVHLNVKILELLADGKLTPQTLADVFEQNSEIVAAFNKRGEEIKQVKING